MFLNVPMADVTPNERVGGQGGCGKKEAEKMILQ